MAAPETEIGYLVPPPGRAENALQRLLGRFQTDQPDTFAHAAAVEALSVDVAKRLRVREPLLGALRLGAFLHDIGKLEVPRRILRKPGPLTTREWARIRRHPVAGVRLLSPIIRSEEALAIVRFHHERWDRNRVPTRARRERDTALGANRRCYGRLLCDERGTVVSAAALV